MKQIKVSEVAGYFAERAGTEIATITQRTPVKMNKTANPFFGRVEKVSTVGMLIGAEYGNMVDKRLAQAGLSGTDFTVDKRSNGMTAVEGTSGKILQNKNGELLLNYIVNDRVTPQVTYLLDGREADAAVMKTLEAFLPAKKVSAKQEDAGLDAVEQVKVRTVKLSNILAINMRGETVIIVE